MKLDLSGIVQRKRQHRLHRKLQAELLVKVLYIVAGLGLLAAIAIRFAVGGEWWVL